jgi:hypothetical protein
MGARHHSDYPPRRHCNDPDAFENGGSNASPAKAALTHHFTLGRSLQAYGTIGKAMKGNAPNVSSTNNSR